jgi:hypothetical protein
MHAQRVATPDWGLLALVGALPLWENGFTSIVATVRLLRIVNSFIGSRLIGRSDITQLT